jgi:hypothetical protein
MRQTGPTLAFVRRVPGPDCMSYTGVCIR